MSVTVRPARPGDAAGIADVWLSVAAYYADLDPVHFQVPPTEGLAEGWEDQLVHATEDALQLVAEAGGRVIGWLSARIELPEENAAVELTREHGWTRLAVDALIVDRGHWRQGAGAGLLEAAEAWGRDRGAQVARLGTYAHSPVSVPFYEDRMGLPAPLDHLPEAALIRRSVRRVRPVRLDPLSAGQRPSGIQWEGPVRRGLADL